jgi:hypothetical protein
MRLIMDSSAREAHHQAAVRASNDLASHVALRSDGTTTETLLLRCECGDRFCTATVPATRSEYASVRELGSRFLIAHAHENPEISVVVAVSPAFAVVDTIGRDARRVVLTANSRRGGLGPPNADAPA